MLCTFIVNRKLHNVSNQHAFLLHLKEREACRLLANTKHPLWNESDTRFSQGRCQYWEDGPRYILRLSHDWLTVLGKNGIKQALRRYGSVILDGGCVHPHKLFTIQHNYLRFLPQALHSFVVFVGSYLSQGVTWLTLFSRIAFALVVITYALESISVAFISWKWKILW